MFIYAQAIKTTLWDLLHEGLQNKIIDMRDGLNNYDTVFNKLTNRFLRNYIETHFMSKGKRINNLSTAKNEHLLRLFTAYIIPKVPSTIQVRPTKDNVVSKSKFQVGKYRYTFVNHFDGTTTNYYLTFNIHKITTCDVFLDISSQMGTEIEKNKLWIHKHEESESISFGTFYIQAANLALIN